MRAPFQILVLPFRHRHENAFEFAIFKRSDAGYWQFIAGGGEDQETPLQAAKREALEEGGISIDSNYFILDSRNTVPINNFSARKEWRKDLFVIPEYTFGVEVKDKIAISSEHCEYKWLSYGEAVSHLKWDSNKNALWELNERLVLKNEARLT